MPMSRPGCQRAPSRPNGDVIVPTAGHTGCAGTAACGRATGAGFMHTTDSRRTSALKSAREGSSENLRAPGRAIDAKELIRTFDAARPQLLQAACVRERPKREAAEVDGRELLRAEAQIRLIVRLARALVRDAESALVPRAQLVVHVEDDPAALLVRAPRHCAL